MYFFFAIKAFLNDFIVETEHRGVVERPILTLCCDPACDLNSACVCVHMTVVLCLTCGFSYRHRLQPAVSWTTKQLES